MPDRLRRLAETFQHLPIYFITTCTQNRRPILATPSVHARLKDFGEKGPGHGAWLGAYVLMPDHLHLFVVVDDGRLALSAWVKALKNSISSELRGNGVPSPHWQKGFFDHLLRSGDSYSAKWEYVRENPVRSNLVKDWRDWEFSGELFDLEFWREQI